MKKINVTHYLVVGPENCTYKSYEEVVTAALKAGFSCVQLRSKTLPDEEMLRLAEKTANIIADLHKSEDVLFLINDRVNVARTARQNGLKVDGVHVGQSDEKPSVCRKLLGEDAIIGLSAPQENLIQFLDTAELSQVDYFGVAPLHNTDTKPDLLRDKNDCTILTALDDISAFAKKTPLPVVVGGGVKKEDIPLIAKTAVSGYFVVSAICGAQNPYEEARKLVQSWENFR